MKENIACLPRRFIIYCSVNVIMPFIIPVLETRTMNNVEKIISVIEKKNFSSTQLWFDRSGDNS